MRNQFELVHGAVIRADASAREVPTQKQVDELYEAYLSAWQATQDAHSAASVAQARFERSKTTENAAAANAAWDHYYECVDAETAALDAFRAAEAALKNSSQVAPV